MKFASTVIFIKDFEVGLLGNEIDADRYLYKQRGNYWDFVPNVRAFGSARGKGLLKLASFDVVFDSSEFRAKDSVSVDGSVGLLYDVRFPDKLIHYDDAGLHTLILNELEPILRADIGSYPSTQIRDFAQKIRASANRALKVLISEYGFVLKITRLSLEATAIEQIKETDEIEDARFPGVQKSAIRTAQLETALLELRELVRIKLLEEEGRVDITLDSERLLKRAQALTSLPLTRDEMIGLIALENPQAARAIAEVVQAQTNQIIEVERLRQEQFRTELLGKYLDAQIHRGQSHSLPTGFSPSQLSPQQTIIKSLPQSSDIDPLITAIRAKFPGVFVSQTQAGGRRKNYKIELGRLTIGINIRRNDITDVAFGEGTLNRRPGQGNSLTIPQHPADSLAERVCKLIDDIQQLTL